MVSILPILALDAILIHPTDRKSWVEAGLMSVTGLERSASRSQGRKPRFAGDDTVLFEFAVTFYQKRTLLGLLTVKLLCGGAV